MNAILDFFRRPNVALGTILLMLGACFLLYLRSCGPAELQGISRRNLIGSWQPDWAAYRKDFLADPLLAKVAEAATEQARTRYASLVLTLDDTQGSVSIGERNGITTWTIQEPPADDEITVLWAERLPLLGVSTRFQKMRGRVYILIQDGLNLVRLPLARH